MWISRWETRTVTVQPGVTSDKVNLDEVLQELWEPFAVTWDGSVFDYHLRRMTTTKEK